MRPSTDRSSSAPPTSPSSSAVGWRRRHLPHPSGRGPCARRARGGRIWQRCPSRAPPRWMSPGTSDPQASPERTGKRSS
eukprot:9491388-Pyramimonas_sp.AAC.1